MVVFPAPEGEERTNISPRRFTLIGTMVELIDFGLLLSISTCLVRI